MPQKFTFDGNKIILVYNVCTVVIKYKIPGLNNGCKCGVYCRKTV